MTPAPEPPPPQLSTFIDVTPAGHTHVPAPVVLGVTEYVEITPPKSKILFKTVIVEEDESEIAPTV